jgi:hypothetical protein
VVTFFPTYHFQFHFWPFLFLNLKTHESYLIEPTRPKVWVSTRHWLCQYHTSVSFCSVVWPLMFFGYTYNWWASTGVLSTNSFSHNKSKYPPLSNYIVLSLIFCSSSWFCQMGLIWCFLWFLARVVTVLITEVVLSIANICNTY